MDKRVSFPEKPDNLKELSVGEIISMLAGIAKRKNRNEHNSTKQKRA